MELAGSIVRDPAALAAVEPAWRELMLRSSSDEPTLTPLWLREWWRIFGPEGGRRLRVVLFRDGGRLVGLAPLLWRRHWYRSVIAFRRIELLGSGEREADEICSDYLGVIVERGREEAVAKALAAALAGALGPWDELILPAMDGEAPMIRPLSRALARPGVTVETEVTATCPYIALPGNFQDYLDALSSAGRYLVKRSLRDFDRWAGGDAVLHQARTSDDLAHGKRVLAALHGERWSAEGQAGVFGSTDFAAFHDAVMPPLLAVGALELLWLTVRGEPVAALYNLVWNGKVYFYQGGRKVDVPKDIRPGIVIHAWAIRAAIAAGRREYDFLAGGSRYKRQLAVSTRPLVRLRAVRSPLLERIRRATERPFAKVGELRERLRAALRPLAPGATR
jgi:CelD/BcsL family acetyltransferase involved in cellulose biosynthesis